MLKLEEDGEEGIISHQGQECKNDNGESLLSSSCAFNNLVVVITKFNFKTFICKHDINTRTAPQSYIIGQRKLTHVPIGLCTKFGELHPELRIFLNFSWVIAIYHFVGCSNVYLKIIVKYEIDHHIRDPLTRDLDFPIFLLIDFKF